MSSPMLQPQRPVDRRAFLGGALAGLFALTAAAGTAGAQTASPADAATPIAQLNQALLAVMKSGHAVPFRQRFDTMAAAIDRAFDLQAVLQSSVGLRWSTMPAAEQAQLMEVFRRYTVANYVANFDSYAGQTITIDPATRSVGNGEQVVATEISSRDGSPTKLSYVMRQTPQGWKAVDVLADGAISRVAVQRSDFRGLLSRGGSSALVASLQQKVADLSGGAVA